MDINDIPGTPSSSFKWFDRPELDEVVLDAVDNRISRFNPLPAMRGLSKSKRLSHDIGLLKAQWICIINLPDSGMTEYIRDHEFYQLKAFSGQFESLLDDGVSMCVINGLECYLPPGVKNNSEDILMFDFMKKSNAHHVLMVKRFLESSFGAESAVNLKFDDTTRVGSVFAICIGEKSQESFTIHAVVVVILPELSDTISPLYDQHGNTAFRNDENAPPMKVHYLQTAKSLRHEAKKGQDRKGLGYGRFLVQLIAHFCRFNGFGYPRIVFVVNDDDMLLRTFYERLGCTKFQWGTQSVDVREYGEQFNYYSNRYPSQSTPTVVYSLRGFPNDPNATTINSLLEVLGKDDIIDEEDESDDGINDEDTEVKDIISRKDDIIVEEDESDGEVEESSQQQQPNKRQARVRNKPQRFVARPSKQGWGVDDGDMAFLEDDAMFLKGPLNVLGGNDESSTANSKSEMEEEELMDMDTAENEQEEPEEETEFGESDSEDDEGWHNRTKKTRKIQKTKMMLNEIKSTRSKKDTQFEQSENPSSDDESNTANSKSEMDVDSESEAEYEMDVESELEPEEDLDSEFEEDAAARKKANTKTGKRKATNATTKTGKKKATTKTGKKPVKSNKAVKSTKAAPEDEIEPQKSGNIPTIEHDGVSFDSAGHYFILQHVQYEQGVVGIVKGVRSTDDGIREFLVEISSNGSPSFVTLDEGKLFKLEFISARKHHGTRRQTFEEPWAINIEPTDFPLLSIENVLVSSEKTNIVSRLNLFHCKNPKDENLSRFIGILDCDGNVIRASEIHHRLLRKFITNSLRRQMKASEHHAKSIEMFNMIISLKNDHLAGVESNSGKKSWSGRGEERFDAAIKDIKDYKSNENIGVADRWSYDMPTDYYFLTAQVHGLKWMGEQRSKKKKNILSAERVQKLDAIDFQWLRVNPFRDHDDIQDFGMQHAMVTDEAINMVSSSMWCPISLLEKSHFVGFAAEEKIDADAEDTRMVAIELRHITKDALKKWMIENSIGVNLSFSSKQALSEMIASAKKLFDQGVDWKVARKKKRKAKNATENVNQLIDAAVPFLKAWFRKHGHCEISWPTCTMDTETKTVGRIVWGARKSAEDMSDEEIEKSKLHKALKDAGYDLRPPKRGRTWFRFEGRFQVVFNQFCKQFDEFRMLELGNWDVAIDIDALFRPDWTKILSRFVTDDDGNNEIDKEALFLECDEHRHDPYYNEQRKVTYLWLTCMKNGIANVEWIRFNSAECIEPHEGQMKRIAELLNTRLESPRKGCHMTLIDYPPGHHHVQAYQARVIKDGVDTPLPEDWEDDEHCLRRIFSSVELLVTEGFEPGL